MKANVNLSIDVEVLKIAKAKGINLSGHLEYYLRKLLIDEVTK